MKKFLTAGASSLRHLSMAAVLLASTVVGVSAHAQAEAADSTEATIKKLIEPRLGKDAKVDAVTKTPYAGLYEIQIDGDVIYTDAKPSISSSGAWSIRRPIATTPRKRSIR